MPTYEYQCEACGRHHEAMRRISDPPLRKCPACGKLRLKRLLSAPVFRLKGGGWYETDFKTDKEGRRNLAGDEGKAEAHTDDQGAAAAKPAAAEVGKTVAATDAKPDSKSGEKAGAKAETKPGADAGSGSKGEGAAIPWPAASGASSPTNVVPSKVQTRTVPS